MDDVFITYIESSGVKSFSTILNVEGIVERMQQKMNGTT
jgi:hypothetical protein